MPKKIPNILYKYKKFDNTSRDMLANNQVYFASPLSFNDPFDCAAQEHMLNNFREEQVTKLASLKFGIPRQSLTKENIQRVRNEIEKQPKMIESSIETNAAFEEYKNYINNYMGILSVSACNDSILMWSHYADFHKGFCIGFFTNSIDFPESAIKEVSYSEARKINFIEQSFTDLAATEEHFCEEFTKEAILTKYIDWKYEQEWRMIGKQGIGTYSNTSIARIIFGLRMPKEDRETIRTVLKDKKVDFFEAVKSEKEFAVEIRQIDN